MRRSGIEVIGKIPCVNFQVCPQVFPAQPLSCQSASPPCEGTSFQPFNKMGYVSIFGKSRARR